MQWNNGASCFLCVFPSNFEHLFTFLIAVELYAVSWRFQTTTNTGIKIFLLNSSRSFRVCYPVCLVRVVPSPCGLLCILLLVCLCIFIIQADYWLMLVSIKWLCDPKEMHALNPSNSFCVGCWTDIRWKWLLLSVHLG